MIVLCPACGAELTVKLPDDRRGDLGKLVGDAVVAAIVSHALLDCPPIPQFPRYHEYFNEAPYTPYTLDGIGVRLGVRGAGYGFSSTG
jgi:hypothetical protein